MNDTELEMKMNWPLGRKFSIRGVIVQSIAMKWRNIFNG
jgi:hypothetical protein